MNRPRYPICLSILLILLLFGCSKSDDQIEFEDQAYAAPDGITETTSDANQEPISVDPDDWRISPMYQGLVRFETLPHPNPVQRNTTIQFDMYVNVIEGIPGLLIHIYDPLDRRLGLRIYNEEQNTLPVGPKLIILDTSIFPQNSSTNLYRIIIFDGRDNVVSYGDIEIQ